MTKIRVTFYLSSGESRGTILEAKDFKEAQEIIKENFRIHKNNNNKNVLYINADHPEGNVFEVIENHVVCIDYEEAE
ncbi:hypothetical protein RGU76_29140 [Bacillus pseudomycoides]|uniref:hypothetical protein n=1 Tax=Bacillus TaxID=1386 RepID=UPI00224942ED|nr:MULTISPECIES: hypothetical protein [Bacillus]MCX2829853.1 hypothetical protein [Bacillus sp. DHT2]MDR4918876.1 hypothetical protein [Bacillus pseudomycoides]